MAENYVRYLMTNIALTSLSAPNRIEDNYLDPMKIKSACREGKRLNTLELVQPSDID